MPNTDTVEQALEAAPTPEETESVQPESSTEQPGGIDALSFDELPDNPEQLRNYLYNGGKLEIPDKAAPIAEEAEKAPEAKAAEEAAAEVEAQKARDLAALDDPLPGRITPKQFAADEQKAMRMQHLLNDGKKPGDPGFVSLWEAKAKIDAMEPGKAAVPPEPTPVEKTSSKVSEAETALKDLRAQRQQAIVDGDPVTDIEQQIEAATDALLAERVEFAVAKERAQSQQAHEAATKAQTAQELRAASQAEVLKEFPDLAKPESPLALAVNQAIAELKQSDSPLLYEPEAPEHVKNAGLKILAKAEGITFAQAALKYAAPQAKAAAQPVVKPVIPPPKKVLPASGSQATQPPKGEASFDDILAQGEKDPRAYAKALYGNRRITALQ